MARIGMRNLVFAPISAETANTITYGTGKLAEHARRGNITYNWAEGSLYGDDILAEYIKEATGADIELEMTELDDAVAVLLGLERQVGETNATYYTMKTAIATPVGFGFLQVHIVNSVRKYRAIWFHKVTFSPSNEESTTREDSIQWGNPTITGKAWAVDLDNVESQIRDYKDFETETAAMTWLKGRANIT